jgi:hypothetical protein
MNWTWHGRKLSLPYLRQSSSFWDTTPCSPFKVNRHFGGTCHLHLQGWRALLASCWFLGRIISPPWRWRRRVPPKRRLTFDELHNVTYQKMELFVTTAVRTLNLRYYPVIQPKRLRKITTFSQYSRSLGSDSNLMSPGSAAGMLPTDLRRSTAFWYLVVVTWVHETNLEMEAVDGGVVRETSRILLYLIR